MPATIEEVDRRLGRQRDPPEDPGEDRVQDEEPADPDEDGGDAGQSSRFRSDVHAR
jgi:hypothetical protein